LPRRACAELFSYIVIVLFRRTGFGGETTMLSNANRAVAAVTAAAIALTAAGVAPAVAAPNAAKENAAVAANTDFSSSHYYRGYGYRRHNNGAAFAAIIGGIAAYAAAREYRKARERSYYGYYDEPYGYYGRPHYWRGW